MKNQFFSIRRLLAVGTVLLLAGLGTAQAQPGSGGPQPAAGPTTTPIDGGASLLLAAGVGLGIRRLKQRRRKALNPPE